MCVHIDLYQLIMIYLYTNFVSTRVHTQTYLIIFTCIRTRVIQGYWPLSSFMQAHSTQQLNGGFLYLTQLGWLVMTQRLARQIYDPVVSELHRFSIPELTCIQLQGDNRPTGNVQRDIVSNLGQLCPTLVRDNPVEIFAAVVRR